MLEKDFKFQNERGEVLKGRVSLVAGYASLAYYHIFRYWKGKLNTGWGWYYEGALFKTDHGWIMDGIFEPRKDDLLRLVEGWGFGFGEKKMAGLPWLPRFRMRTLKRLHLS